MATVSTSDGSVTTTGWNRLANAGSFSMYFLYSSNVVAPTQCSSPLAKAGFNIFDASIELSTAPAPTSVCNSSINTMTFPSSSMSFNIACNRSSKSPLYFAPDMILAKSNKMTLLSFIDVGTSPFTILAANPSMTAVFPTPGSPINTGLFFVLLANTCNTLLITGPLPITGSIFPCFANSVRSFPYFFNASPGFGASSHFACIPGPPFWYLLIIFEFIWLVFFFLFVYILLMCCCCFIISCPFFTPIFFHFFIVGMLFVILFLVMDIFVSPTNFFIFFVFFLIFFN
mmetsp:Transcript_13370/g.20177  ORF Transcript_13370/g.20177 Transcript_13370/m.20177 type:complete len:286 (-) Transcript_13370:48-905(-)